MRCGGIERSGRRQRARRTAVLCTALLVGFAPVGIGHAETLQQALTAAYESNPRLDAERARLRATDETVPRAMSGWRPIVRGEAAYGVRDLSVSPSSPAAGRTNPASVGVRLTQPVFDGLQTRNAVSAAEAEVRAGRELLRQIESETLLAAATAYTDVVRDQEIVRLNEHNVKTLARELAAVRTRKAARDATVTDVSQAEARHARALSTLDEARANLRTSEADYRRIVGHGPERLSMPAYRPRSIPGSLTEALAIAADESPAIGRALYVEQAARHTVDRVWGELLPQVRLEADYLANYDETRAIDRETSASITGRVTIPLYDGGETRARVREAKHRHVGRIQDIEVARTEAEARVTAAWSRLKAALARQSSDQAQVRANQTALDGVRAEADVGQRTLLDVLNAEQELLDARAGLVRTRRDIVVAQFTLLAAIGRLDAQMLDLAAEFYDPSAHYEEARDKWFTVSITEDRPPDPAAVRRRSRERTAAQPPLRRSAIYDSSLRQDPMARSADGLRGSLRSDLGARGTIYPGDAVGAEPSSGSLRRTYAD